MKEDEPIHPFCVYDKINDKAKILHISNVATCLSSGPGDNPSLSPAYAGLPVECTAVRRCLSQRCEAQRRKRTEGRRGCERERRAEPTRPPPGEGEKMCAESVALDAKWQGGRRNCIDERCRGGGGAGPLARLSPGRASMRPLSRQRCPEGPNPARIPDQAADERPGPSHKYLRRSEPSAIMTRPRVIITRSHYPNDLLCPFLTFTTNSHHLLVTPGRRRVGTAGGLGRAAVRVPGVEVEFYCCDKRDFTFEGKGFSQRKRQGEGIDGQIIIQSQQFKGVVAFMISFGHNINSW